MKTLQVKGKNYTATRERLYCRTESGWNRDQGCTHKYGWVVRNEAGKEVWGNPVIRPAVGSDRPRFGTFADVLAYAHEINNRYERNREQTA